MAPPEAAGWEMEMARKEMLATCCRHRYLPGPGAGISRLLPTKQMGSAAAFPSLPLPLVLGPQERTGLAPPCPTSTVAQTLGEKPPLLRAQYLPGPRGFLLVKTAATAPSRPLPLQLHPPSRVTQGFLGSPPGCTGREEEPAPQDIPQPGGSRALSP